MPSARPGDAMPASSGFTLIELLVVLALLALVLSVTPLALPRAKAQADWNARLAAARLTAARESRAVKVTDSCGHPFLALPDGSVLGPAVDLLTGEVDARTR